MSDLRYNLSYWERETFFKNIDVVIIGSGLVGLTAAIHLKRRDPKLHVVVVERGALPIGASTRNAGFACFGSMTELIDDMEHMSEAEVLSIVEKRWRGLQRLREIVGDDRLGFQMRGGYEMFTDDEADVYQACIEKMPEFNQKIGKITGNPQVYSAVNAKIPQFGFKGVSHLILNQSEGQVNTGMMMAALIQIAQDAGVKLYNGISIAHFEDTSQGVELQTDFGWSFMAAKTLVAVNGFAQRLLGDSNVQVQPARNQVLITKPIPGLKVEGCFHYDRGYYYFRNIDGRVLLGGGRNLAPDIESTDQFGTTELIKTALIQLLKKVILPNHPEVEIDGWWSGILGLGPQKKPIVKRISNNVAISVRLSGMGVAIGSLVGQEGADLVLG